MMTTPAVPSSSRTSARTVAADAVRARPSQFGVPSTPSVAAILHAYEQQGNGDREMLLALLEAKRAEDHRLAMLDMAYAHQCHLAAASLSSSSRSRLPAVSPNVAPALSAGGSASTSDEDDSPASPPDLLQARPPTTWHGRLGKRSRSASDEGDALEATRLHKAAMNEVRQRILARRAPISDIRGGQ